MSYSGFLLLYCRDTALTSGHDVRKLNKAQTPLLFNIHGVLKILTFKRFYSLLIQAFAFNRSNVSFKKLTITNDQKGKTIGQSMIPCPIKMLH